MGYRAKLQGVLPAIFSFAALFGASACRADNQNTEHRALNPKSSGALQGLHRRNRPLASRHAPRGLRSWQIASGSRDGSAGVSGIESGGLTDSFLRSAVEVSRRIGCHSRDLLAVMMRESHINPHAQNRSSSAVGLIQFLPGTLAHLGWTGTVEYFRNLTAEEQLPWVEKFLRPSSQYGLGSAARVYQAVFMPASLRLGAGDDTALVDCRGVFAERYQRNRPLDIDGDGRITVRELQQAIDKCCQSLAWQEVERRRRAVEEGSEASNGAVTAARHPSRTLNTVQVGPSAGVAVAPRRGERTAALSPASVNSIIPLSPDEDREPAPKRGIDSEALPGTSADMARQAGGPSAAIDLRTSAGLCAALNALGYDADPAALSLALRTFQRREGLKADGVPGQKTRSAIAAKLSAAGLTVTL